MNMQSELGFNTFSRLKNIKIVNDNSKNTTLF